MHKTGNFYSVFWASPESAVFQDNPVKIILMPKRHFRTAYSSTLQIKHKAKMTSSINSLYLILY